MVDAYCLVVTMSAKAVPQGIATEGGRWSFWRTNERRIMKCSATKRCQLRFLPYICTACGSAEELNIQAYAPLPLWGD
ncbi:MAG: hypothetical protein WCC61_03590 [Pseudomonas sp.]|uniref:hypothetical protein n=1 Tax=unclassified Pseudomonas TaxID=196821 RepID=UPI0011AF256A|nr:hypothetical protein [Pseudomonas sp. AD21]